MLAGLPMTQTFVAFEFCDRRENDRCGSRVRRKSRRYGLAAPAITFTATEDNGKSATLLVGKKEGNDYFAKDFSRPTIFKVNEMLSRSFQKLTATCATRSWFT